MMSRSYYLRVEPRTTASDLTAGIAARIYDPLWMLGRQWQLGELLGEDAGSAVNARLDAETALLSTYRPARDALDTSYDPGALPLDVLVEAGPVRNCKGWTLQLRIDTGREFLRALSDAGLDDYAAAFLDGYGFEAADAEQRAADPGAARLLEVALGRIPDGRELYRQIGGALDVGAALPEPPVATTADVDILREAARAWFAWCSETVFESGPASAWCDDTLDYEFSVATSVAGDATRLDAREQRGGGLDWHSFDARPQLRPADFRALPPIDGLPTGVRFRGMPNARWWEFEDASVDFGSVDAGASDVARLALMEFALVYANDFFAIPLRLDVGALCRITSLIVTDTFGMNQRIAAAAHGAGRQGDVRWSMFTLSERDPAARTAAGVADLFFLPPTAQQVLADRPVEEVLLLRDEMANLAWAVERRYEGARGVAQERHEEAQRNRVPVPPPDTGAQLRYLLGTEVPPYWFPLVPVNVSGALCLAPQRMTNQPASVMPRGTFVRVGGTPVIDCAVPREGRQLLRDFALTRWSNGTSLLWSRRRSGVGRGEGTSGLRFDVASRD
jgi:hypothetical protein